MENFPLESECSVCGKYTQCPMRDEDLNGCVCHECLPHLLDAADFIISDLMSCGILK